MPISPSSSQGTSPMWGWRRRILQTQSPSTRNTTTTRASHLKENEVETTNTTTAKESQKEVEPFIGKMHFDDIISIGTIDNISQGNRLLDIPSMDKDYLFTGHMGDDFNPTTVLHGLQQPHDRVEEIDTIDTFSQAPPLSDAQTFSLNNLVADHVKVCIKYFTDSILQDISSCRTWEHRTKVLCKETLVRYENYSKRKEIYALNQDEPEKLEALKKSATEGKMKASTTYNDDILDTILNKLENLNGEVQAYFNCWTMDKNKVSVAESEKNVWKSKYEHLRSTTDNLVVHIEKANIQIKKAICMEEIMQKKVQENNYFREVINTNGFNPYALLRKQPKETTDDPIKEDPTKEERELLVGIEAAQAEVRKAGALQTSNST